MQGNPVLVFGINILPIAVTLLEIFLVVYVTIAMVVIRQIRLMTRTIQSKYNTYLFLIAYVHLITVITVFILTLVIL